VNATNHHHFFSSSFCPSSFLSSENVSNRIGVKFGRIVLQVNTHRLTESDF